MRERFRDWLEQAGIDGQVSLDLVIACIEAFNNAVEHPVKPTRAFIDVKASLVGDAVVLTIRDSGDWQDMTPPPNVLTTAIRSSARSWTQSDIAREDAETVVTPRKRPSKPARSAAGRLATSAPAI